MATKIKTNYRVVVVSVPYVRPSFDSDRLLSFNLFTIFRGLRVGSYTVILVIVKLKFFEWFLPKYLYEERRGSTHHMQE